MRAPFARDINRPHGAEILEIFQALAAGAFAQVQASDEVIHRQRLMRNEKQPVNFGDGAGLAEGAGKLDEEVDDLHFHRFQSRIGAVYFVSVFHLSPPSYFPQFETANYRESIAD